MNDDTDTGSGVFFAVGAAKSSIKSSSSFKSTLDDTGLAVMDAFFAEDELELELLLPRPKSSNSESKSSIYVWVV